MNDAQFSNHYILSRGLQILCRSAADLDPFIDALFHSTEKLIF